MSPTEWVARAEQRANLARLPFVARRLSSRFSVQPRRVTAAVLDGVTSREQTAGDAEAALHRRTPEAMPEKGRLIEPPLADLDSLPAPLTAGEREVLELFDSCLADEWEIYIQPYLNGLRPDFVLLHPRNGIAVFG